MSDTVALNPLQNVSYACPGLAPQSQRLVPSFFENALKGAAADFSIKAVNPNTTLHVAHLVQNHFKSFCALFTAFTSNSSLPPLNQFFLNRNLADPKLLFEALQNKSDLVPGIHEFTTHLYENEKEGLKAFDMQPYPNDRVVSFVLGLADNFNTLRGDLAQDQAANYPNAPSASKVEAARKLRDEALNEELKRHRFVDSPDEMRAGLDFFHQHPEIIEGYLLLSYVDKALQFSEPQMALEAYALLDYEIYQYDACLLLANFFLVNQNKVDTLKYANIALKLIEDSDYKSSYYTLTDTLSKLLNRLGSFCQDTNCDEAFVQSVNQAKAKLQSVLKEIPAPRTFCPKITP